MYIKTFLSTDFCSGEGGLVSAYPGMDFPDEFFRVMGKLAVSSFWLSLDIVLSQEFPDFRHVCQVGGLTVPFHFSSGFLLFLSHEMKGLDWKMLEKPWEPMSETFLSFRPDEESFDTTAGYPDLSGLPNDLWLACETYNYVGKTENIRLWKSLVNDSFTSSCVDDDCLGINGVWGVMTLSIRGLLSGRVNEGYLSQSFQTFSVASTYFTTSEKLMALGDATILNGWHLRDDVAAKLYTCAMFPKAVPSENVLLQGIKLQFTSPDVHILKHNIEAGAYKSKSDKYKDRVRTMADAMRKEEKELISGGGEMDLIVDVLKRVAKTMIPLKTVGVSEKIVVKEEDMVGDLHDDRSEAPIQIRMLPSKATCLLQVFRASPENSTKRVTGESPVIVMYVGGIDTSRDYIEGFISAARSYWFAQGGVTQRKCTGMTIRNFHSIKVTPDKPKYCMARPSQMSEMQESDMVQFTGPGLRRLGHHLATLGLGRMIRDTMGSTFGIIREATVEDLVALKAENVSPEINQDEFSSPMDILVVKLGVRADGTDSITPVQVIEVKTTVRRLDMKNVMERRAPAPGDEQLTGKDMKTYVPDIGVAGTKAVDQLKIASMIGAASTIAIAGFPTSWVSQNIKTGTQFEEIVFKKNTTTIAGTKIYWNPMRAIGAASAVFRYILMDGYGISCPESMRNNLGQKTYKTEHMRKFLADRYPIYPEPECKRIMDAASEAMSRQRMADIGSWGGRFTYMDEETDFLSPILADMKKNLDGFAQNKPYSGTSSLPMPPPIFGLRVEGMFGIAKKYGSDRMKSAISFYETIVDWAAEEFPFTPDQGGSDGSDLEDAGSTQLGGVQTVSDVDLQDRGVVDAVPPTSEETPEAPPDTVVGTAKHVVGFEIDSNAVIRGRVKNLSYRTRRDEGMQKDFVKTNGVGWWIQGSTVGTTTMYKKTNRLTKGKRDPKIVGYKNLLLEYYSNAFGLDDEVTFKREKEHEAFLAGMMEGLPEDFDRESAEEWLKAGPPSEDKASVPPQHDSGAELAQYVDYLTTPHWWKEEDLSKFEEEMMPGLNLRPWWYESMSMSNIPGKYAEELQKEVRKTHLWLHMVACYAWADRIKRSGAKAEALSSTCCTLVFSDGVPDLVMMGEKRPKAGRNCIRTQVMSKHSYTMLLGGDSSQHGNSMYGWKNFTSSPISHSVLASVGAKVDPLQEYYVVTSSISWPDMFLQMRKLSNCLGPLLASIMTTELPDAKALPLGCLVPCRENGDERISPQIPAGCARGTQMTKVDRVKIMVYVEGKMVETTQKELYRMVVSGGGYEYVNPRIAVGAYSFAMNLLGSKTSGAPNDARAGMGGGPVYWGILAQSKAYKYTTWNKMGALVRSYFMFQLLVKCIGVFTHKGMAFYVQPNLITSSPMGRKIMNFIPPAADRCPKTLQERNIHASIQEADGLGKELGPTSGLSSELSLYKVRPSAVKEWLKGVRPAARWTYRWVNKDNHDLDLDRLIEDGDQETDSIYVASGNGPGKVISGPLTEEKAMEILPKILSMTLGTKGEKNSETDCGIMQIVCGSAQNQGRMRLDAIHKHLPEAFKESSVLSNASHSASSWEGEPMDKTESIKRTFTLGMTTSEVCNIVLSAMYDIIYLARGTNEILGIMKKSGLVARESGKDMEAANRAIAIQSVEVTTMLSEAQRVALLLLGGDSNTYNLMAVNNASDAIRLMTQKFKEDCDNSGIRVFTKSGGGGPSWRPGKPKPSMSPSDLKGKVLEFIQIAQNDDLTQQLPSMPNGAGVTSVYTLPTNESGVLSDITIYSKVIEHLCQGRLTKESELQSAAVWDVKNSYSRKGWERLKTTRTEGTYLMDDDGTVIRRNGKGGFNGQAASSYGGTTVSLKIFAEKVIRDWIRKNIPGDALVPLKRGSAAWNHFGKDNVPFSEFDASEFKDGIFVTGYCCFSDDETQISQLPSFALNAMMCLLEQSTNLHTAKSGIAKREIGQGSVVGYTIDMHEDGRIMITEQFTREMSAANALRADGLMAAIYWQESLLQSFSAAGMPAAHRSIVYKWCLSMFNIIFGVSPSMWRKLGIDPKYIPPFMGGPGEDCVSIGGPVAKILATPAAALRRKFGVSWAKDCIGHPEQLSLLFLGIFIKSENETLVTRMKTPEINGSVKMAEIFRVKPDPSVGRSLIVEGRISHELLSDAIGPLKGRNKTHRFKASDQVPKARDVRAMISSVIAASSRRITLSKPLKPAEGPAFNKPLPIRISMRELMSLMLFMVPGFPEEDRKFWLAGKRVGKSMGMSLVIVPDDKAERLADDQKMRLPYLNWADVLRAIEDDPITGALVEFLAKVKLKSVVGNDNADPRTGRAMLDLNSIDLSRMLNAQATAIWPDLTMSAGIPRANSSYLVSTKKVVESVTGSALSGKLVMEALTERAHRQFSMVAYVSINPSSMFQMFGTSGTRLTSDLRMVYSDVENTRNEGVVAKLTRAASTVLGIIRFSANFDGSERSIAARCSQMVDRMRVILKNKGGNEIDFDSVPAVRAVVAKSEKLGAFAHYVAKLPMTATQNIERVVQNCKVVLVTLRSTAAVDFPMVLAIRARERSYLLVLAFSDSKKDLSSLSWVCVVCDSDLAMRENYLVSLCMGAARIRGFVDGLDVVGAKSAFKAKMNSHFVLSAEPDGKAFDIKVSQRINFAGMADSTSYKRMQSGIGTIHCRIQPELSNALQTRDVPSIVAKERVCMMVGDWEIYPPKIPYHLSPYGSFLVRVVDPQRESTENPGVNPSMLVSALMLVRGMDNIMRGGCKTSWYEPFTNEGRAAAVMGRDGDEVKDSNKPKEFPDFHPSDMYKACAMMDWEYSDTGGVAGMEIPEVRMKDPDPSDVIGGDEYLPGIRCGAGNLIVAAVLQEGYQNKEWRVTGAFLIKLALCPDFSALATRFPFDGEKRQIPADEDVSTMTVGLSEKEKKAVDKLGDKHKYFVNYISSLGTADDEYGIRKIIENSKNLADAALIAVMYFMTGSEDDEAVVGGVGMVAGDGEDDPDSNAGNAMFENLLGNKKYSDDRAQEADDRDTESVGVNDGDNSEATYVTSAAGETNRSVTDSGSGYTPAGAGAHMPRWKGEDENDDDYMDEVRRERKLMAGDSDSDDDRPAATWE